MRKATTLLGALAAIALIATVTGASAAATSSNSAGLWRAGQQAAATDCGGFPRAFRDSNNFCFNDEGGSGVELGVKFRTSKTVKIVGARVYRVDPNAVFGSLWSANGGLLATGQFGPYAGHGWQDLFFSAPVTISPGESYIASYFSSGIAYAFEYDFFTNNGFTVGPLTALQSVEGNRNGVYNYNPSSMFPTDSYRDTNYWVTPLWLSYRFTGFFAPIDTNAWNTAKAGSSVPVKFSLGGYQGLDILEASYPKWTPIACPGTSTPGDTVTGGAGALSYNATNDQYTYQWKTSKDWAGKCFRFDLGLNDLSSNAFNVAFKG
jgi:Domain of unknown function (DUF4082)